MRRSIRWRLQVWYGLVLLTVVAGFAGILYYRVRAARLQEAEAGLEAAALYLDANLRRFPPRDLDDSLPGPPPPPPGGSRAGPARRPGQRSAASPLPAAGVPAAGPGTVVRGPGPPAAAGPPGG